MYNLFPLIRWRLIDVITEKLADFPEEKETWRKSVVTAAIKCLIASYSSYKDQVTSPSEQERRILERLCRHLVGFSSKHICAHLLLFQLYLTFLLFLFSHHLKTSLHLSGTVLSRMD